MTAAPVLTPSGLVRGCLQSAIVVVCVRCAWEHVVSTTQQFAAAERAIATDGWLLDERSDGLVCPDCITRKQRADAAREAKHREQVRLAEERMSAIERRLAEVNAARRIRQHMEGQCVAGRGHEFSADTCPDCGMTMAEYQAQRAAVGR